MINKKEILKKSIEKNQVPVGFTTHEAASTLSVSFTTIISWISKGKIKCYRTLGGHRRILPEEIERVSKLISKNNEIVTSATKTMIKPASTRVTMKPATKPIHKPVIKPKAPVHDKPVTKTKVKIVSDKKSISTPSKKVSVNKKQGNISKSINKI